MTGWKRTVATSFAAQVLSIVGFSFALPFLPFFLLEIGVPEGPQQAWLAGVTLAAAGVTFALFSPVWGALADRYGRKPMVVRSMIGGAVVLMLMSMVQTVWQLVVCRLMQGMVTGTISASVALVASVTPERRGGLAMGLMQSAVFVGMTLGPLAGGLIADAFGYRVAFRVGAGIVLLGGMLVLWGAQEPRRSETSTVAPRRSLRQLLAGRGILIGTAVLFSERFTNTMTNPAFPLIVVDIVATPTRLNSITGSLTALSALTGAVAAASLGHWGDRVGYRRVLIVCSLGAALMSMAHAAARSVAALAVVRLGFGLFVAGVLPAANALIKATVAERDIGRAFGAATSLSMIGIALGPLLGGYLARDHGLRMPFVAAGIAQLAVCAMAARFLRPTPTGT